MTILAARLRQSTAAALQDGKDGWAKRIDVKAVPQHKAAGDLIDAEAQVTIARGIERAVADLVQVALTRLKRDLKNIGLTETQIHDIIPDYVPKPKKDADKPAETAKPAETTATTKDPAPAAPVAPAAPAAPVTPTP